MTLPEARRIGLTRVLITADDSNVASWRIIERNGGQCEPGLLMTESGALRRSWLDTLPRISVLRGERTRQFPLADLFRQSIYGRLGGYEDINDAERLADSRRTNGTRLP